MNIIPTIFVFFVITELGANCGDSTEFLQRLNEFRISLNDVDTFNSVLSSEIFSNLRSTKGPKLFSLSDVEDFHFSGTRDGDGLPDSPGILSSEEDNPQEVCIKGKCQLAIKYIQGNFTKGRLNGPARVSFHDGTKIITTASNSVLHGLYNEFVDKYFMSFVGYYVNGKRQEASWYFDNKMQTLFYVNRQSNHGCLGDLGEESRIFCGQIENNSLKKGKLCTEFKSELLNGTLFAECLEYLPDSPDFSFHPASNLQSKIDIAKAQSIWFRLKLMKPKTKTIFMNENLDSLDKLRPLSREYKTTCEIAPLKCRLGVLNVLHLPEDSVYEHVGVAFPGSGSKWVFQLISLAVGIKNYELWLEHERVYIPNSAFLIKSHHQRAENYQKSVRGHLRSSEDLLWRFNHIIQFGGRAILLIRNPYDAVLSHWNHAQAGEHNVAHDMIESIQTEEFLQFALTEIVLWFEIIQDWLSIGSDVFVIHYENVRQDLGRELRKVGGYLNLEVGEDRIFCLERAEITQHKRQGKPKLPSDIYKKELHDKFDQIIDQAQSLLIQYGQEVMPVDRYSFYKSNKP